jgi:glutamine amidotransferase
VVSGLDVAYYANSFVCRPTATHLPFVSAWSEHDGDRFPASVRRGNIIGTQFHPEKSSAHGVAFVREFLHFAASLRSTS